MKGGGGGTRNKKLAGRKNKGVIKPGPGRRTGGGTEAKFPDKNAPTKTGRDRGEVVWRTAIWENWDRTGNNERSKL